ncbi:hypothetical protein [Streptomyces antibioticus]|uniref:hypothetical protein n=1 Tax=Streptomyces antibioticus TaxID=1890 RepID=UPI0036B32F78
MRNSIAHTAPPPAAATYTPPLDVARAQARRVLGEADALDLDITGSFELAGRYGELCEALRQVLAAFDAEYVRHA